jgi:hypothetical protein
MNEEKFLKALQSHRAWRRKHLPGMETSAGRELLRLLLTSKGAHTPLAQLYRRSRHSRLALRKALAQFEAMGLLRVTSEARGKMVVGNPRLFKTLSAFFQQLRKLGDD